MNGKSAKRSLKDHKPLMTIKMNPIMMVTLLGQLLLALKHPENRGPSSELARRFACILARRLIDECEVPRELYEEWRHELPVE